MILLLWKNKVCISNVVFILCPYCSILGLNVAFFHLYLFENYLSDRPSLFIFLFFPPDSNFLRNLW